MQVNTVSNVLGYAYDYLLTERRTTYNYDKGNDVTVVERRSYKITLYDQLGNLQEHQSKGENVDKRV